MVSNAINGDTPCPNCGSMALTRAGSHALWYCAGCCLCREIVEPSVGAMRQTLTLEDMQSRSGYEPLPDGSGRITRGYRDKDGSWVESSEVVPASPRPGITIINTTKARIDKAMDRIKAGIDRAIEEHRKSAAKGTP